MSVKSTTNIPKYISLAELLRTQITQEQLRPGDRLPSFAEMREQHGVTIGTVNRIYAHLEKDGFVVREQGRGTFVNRRDERPVTGVIGISGFTSSQHPYATQYFTQLLRGFREAASQTDIELLLLQNDTKIPVNKIDGLIVCIARVIDLENGIIDRDWSLSELPAGMPCVTALVNLNGVASVVADEYQGAYDLTRHLLELGHRRIAALYDLFSPARLTGYRNALRDAKVEVNEQWIRTVSYDQTPECTYSASGCATMHTWLKEDWAHLGCTALVAHNDDAAIGVIHALREARWKVPEQVSVAGFDGTEIGRFFQPQLTSVEMPLQGIGAMAMELLLRRVRGEKVPVASTVLQPAFFAALRPPSPQ